MTWNTFLDYLARAPLSWREALDIALVGFIFYRLILMVRGTRAVSVIHGIVVVLLAYYLSGEFGLFTLHWLLTNFLSSFFLVLVILFQADIRKGLSEVGLRWFGGAKRGGVAAETVEKLVAALRLLADRRIGALVVLERGVPLGDLAAKGVEMTAPVNADVLLTLFNTQSPLHDGAVLVQSGQVSAVACILPLAAHHALAANMGTRHRAAVGVTEETDALALVVSEEKGVISAAEGGQLSDSLDDEALRRLLLTKWAGGL